MKKTSGEVLVACGAGTGADRRTSPSRGAEGARALTSFWKTESRKMRRLARRHAEHGRAIRGEENIKKEERGGGARGKRTEQLGLGLQTTFIGEKRKLGCPIAVSTTRWLRGGVGSLPYEGDNDRRASLSLMGRWFPLGLKDNMDGRGD
jgi:hypothetical protein